jgi:hypothetical protein
VASIQRTQHPHNSVFFFWAVSARVVRLFLYTAVLAKSDHTSENLDQPISTCNTLTITCGFLVARFVPLVPSEMATATPTHATLCRPPISCSNHSMRQTLARPLIG